MSKSVTKGLKKVKKNISKSKDQMVQEILHTQKVAKIKEIVKKVYPLIESQGSVYDAQTVVNALSGFITAHIEKKVLDIPMSDINIDLSQEEDSSIKEAIIAIMEANKDESAQVLCETLDQFGRTLSQYSAHVYMKQPMNTIKLEDLITK